MMRGHLTADEAALSAIAERASQRHALARRRHADRRRGRPESDVRATIKTDDGARIFVSYNSIISHI
jgi:hypothetical protein